MISINYDYFFDQFLSSSVTVGFRNRARPWLAWRFSRGTNSGFPRSEFLQVLQVHTKPIVVSALELNSHSEKQGGGGKSRDDAWVCNKELMPRHTQPPFTSILSIACWCKKKMIMQYAYVLPCHYFSFASSVAISHILIYICVYVKICMIVSTYICVYLRRKTKGAFKRVEQVRVVQKPFSLIQSGEDPYHSLSWQVIFHKEPFN